MTNFDMKSGYVGTREVQKILLGTGVVWPTIDYSQIPLTFEIVSGGTINWVAGNPFAWKRTIQYKVNDGEWTSITSAKNTDPATIAVNAGDIVQFKATNGIYARSGSTEYTTFETSSAKFKVYGNIMSLINENTFSTLTGFSNGATDVFRNLFRETSDATKTGNIVDVSNLVLPATSLASKCYADMFNGRDAITKAPKLPASILAESCYSEMFMGCTSLSEITCLATDMTATDCTAGWLNRVSATGTFIKHQTATWSSGTSGIPTGWTVIDA